MSTNIDEKTEIKKSHEELQANILEELSKNTAFQRMTYIPNNFTKITKETDGNFDKIGGIPSFQPAEYYDGYGWPECNFHKINMQFFFQITIPHDMWKQHIKLNDIFTPIDNNVIQLFVCLKCRGMGQSDDAYMIRNVNYDKCIPFDKLKEYINNSFNKKFSNEHYIENDPTQDDEEDLKENDEEYQKERIFHMTSMNIYNYMLDNCYDTKTEHIVWLNNKDEYYLKDLRIYKPYTPYAIIWKEKKEIESLKVIRRHTVNKKWLCTCDRKYDHYCFQFAYECYHIKHENLCRTIKIGGYNSICNGRDFEVDHGHIITFGDFEQLPFMWGDSGLATIDTKQDRLDFICH